MANEAVIIELINRGEGIRWLVDDADAVPKGTLMVVDADPRKTKISSADGEFFIGVAAMEKVASDGSTEISVLTKGIFDLQTHAESSAIAVGERVKISGANFVALADDDTVGNAQEVVGVALEDAAAQTTETIAVAIGIY